MAVHSDGDGVLEFAAKPQKPGRRAPRVGFTPRLDLGLPADGAALADFGSLDPTQTGDGGVVFIRVVPVDWSSRQSP